MVENSIIFPFIANYLVGYLDTIKVQIVMVLVMLLFLTWLDIKERIIPHRYTVWFICFGFMCNLYMGDVLMTILGIMYGYIFGIIGYKSRVWGGGDVTSLTVIGSFLGLAPVMVISTLIFLLFGVYRFICYLLRVKDVPMLPLIFLCTLSMLVSFI